MQTNISGIVSGIYKLEDVVSGSVYVGSADSDTGIAKRWSSHNSHFKAGDHKYKQLQDSYNLNKNNIQYEILELCDDNELEERESYYFNYVDKMIDGWTFINKQKTPARRSKVKDVSRMVTAQTAAQNGNVKYSVDLIRKVKAKMADGITLEEISKETGIGVNYLNQIKYGYKWVSVSID